MIIMCMVRITAISKLNLRLQQYSLSDYSDAYIRVTGTLTVTNAMQMLMPITQIKKISKYCAPFTHWISEIINIQEDNAKDIDVVMLM